MRTTLGELVSELVDQYERIYHDHELATVAASVTLEDILREQAIPTARETEPTLKIRKSR